MVLLTGLMLVAAGTGAQQQAEKKDMRLAGYHDLQGRGAYRPVIQHSKGRWIAYIGHHDQSALWDFPLARSFDSARAIPRGLTDTA
jgi:hypothetical protein